MQLRIHASIINYEIFTEHYSIIFFFFLREVTLGTNFLKTEGCAMHRIINGMKIISFIQQKTLVFNV